MATIPDSHDSIVQLLEPGERERPTLKTIARISGLAVPTVSRALSDAPDISSDTKEKVRTIADLLGYRPNRAGLRLRTGKTNVIALVLSTDHEVMNHTARLIGSLAAELRGTPYHLIVMPYFPDESPMVPIEYIVRTGSADGIIMNRIEPDDPRIRYLRSRKFPFAMHGRTADCETAPYFDFDNAAFARLTVEEGARRGRKSVAVLAPPLEQSYAGHMVAGATEAARENGLAFRLIEGANSDSPAVEVTKATAAHLERYPDTDFVITSSAPSAIAAVSAIEDAGRVVGQDIDVGSKEAIPLLKQFRRDIIVTSEDINATGTFLAKAIIQAINQPDLPPMQHLAAPGPQAIS